MILNAIPKKLPEYPEKLSHQSTGATLFWHVPPRALATPQ